MERKIIEENEITQALRKITYGFYIITARNGEDIAAGAVCWAIQSSFEPPTVTVCLKNDSHLKQVVEAGGYFVVNVIGKAQKLMLSPFFKETQVEDHKLNGYPFSNGVTGVPVLDRLPAYIECRVDHTVNPGDHTIFVGEVVGYGVRNKDAEPLIEWETDLRYGG